MKNQNSLLLLITTFYLLVGCNSTEKGEQLLTLTEIEVIDNMGCWQSVEGEIQMNLAIRASDEEKSNKLMDKWIEYQLEAKEFGQQKLIEDTVFINVIRTESMYDTLLNERSSLAKKLLEFRKLVPKFGNKISEINDQVIEYNFVKNNELGIYTDSYVKEGLLNIEGETYYSSLSDLFKQAYIHDTDANVSDDEISLINDLLKGIEEIDKHIWAVPYYQESKQKVDSNNEKLRIKNAKKQKMDSLLK